MNKKTFIIILSALFILLNVIGLLRWSHDSDRIDDMSYTMDRWTGQMWVKFYPSNGVFSYPPEFPVFNNDKYINSQQLVEKVKLQSVSGLLVKEWIIRSRLTDLYYSINVLLILLIIILVVRIRNEKNRNKN